jgi:hypothetical protein
MESDHPLPAVRCLDLGGIEGLQGDNVLVSQERARRPFVSSIVLESKFNKSVSASFSATFAGMWTVHV